jgi:hypothetical protein
MKKEEWKERRDELSVRRAQQQESSAGGALCGRSVCTHKQRYMHEHYADATQRWKFVHLLSCRADQGPPDTEQHCSVALSVCASALWRRCGAESVCAL